MKRLLTFTLILFCATGFAQSTDDTYHTDANAIRMYPASPDSAHSTTQPSPDNTFYVDNSTEVNKEFHAQANKQHSDTPDNYYYSNGNQKVSNQYYEVPTVYSNETITAYLRTNPYR